MWTEKKIILFHCTCLSSRSIPRHVHFRSKTGTIQQPLCCNLFQKTILMCTSKVELKREFMQYLNIAELQM